jgi:UDP-glucose 4-epimerase
MRVIVIGASGRVGRAILRGVADHQEVTHVVSLTEESPEAPKLDGETPIEHRRVDLFDDLSDHFKFADAAVYGGWPISDVSVGLRKRQMEALSNVCQSIGGVGVRAFVYCSSAGAYAPAPPGRAVDETWPILESPPSAQLSQLARAERIVGCFEDHYPLIRVVRLRSGVIVYPAWDRPQTIAGRILRRIYGPHWWRFVPDLGPYALQCVHVDDFVNALCLALTQSVSGPFNIAADPITSDLLAEVFAAKKIRLAPQHLQRILTLGSRLRLLSGAINWAELALRRQVLDTTRAQRDLHWPIEHPARSIVSDWVENSASGTDRAETKGEANITNTSVENTAMDLGFLYEQSLAYFGEKVHAVPDDKWGSSSGAGLTVWQIVASIALDQYRVSLAAHGHGDDTIESQLPGDPLGIAPMDGWDLAAERGRLAVVPPDSPTSDEDNFLPHRLGEMLPPVIFELVRGGSELGRVLGSETLVPHELARFTERMEPPRGVRA